MVITKPGAGYAGGGGGAGGAGGNAGTPPDSNPGGAGVSTV